MKNRSTIKDGKLVIDTELLGIKKLYKSIDNDFDKEIFVKVRSTGKLLKAKADIEKTKAIVDILDDEKGISPGQACVFYDKDNFGERVLGGGWIDKTEKNYPHN